MSRIILRNVSTVPLSLLKVNPHCLYCREKGKFFSDRRKYERYIILQKLDFDIIIF